MDAHALASPVDRSNGGLQPVHLELPAFADEPIVLTDPVSGVGVAVMPLDVARVSAEDLNGALSFPNALGTGHIVLRHNARGFEDTTHFEETDAGDRALRGPSHERRWAATLRQRA